MTHRQPTPHRTVPNHLLMQQVCALLARGKQVKLQAKGNSMLPFIRQTTDTLLLSPLTTAPAKGDVVLAYTTDHRYVVHRIARVQPHSLLLRGDANPLCTETCHPANVKGVATAVIRTGRTISLQTRRHRMASALWSSLLPLRPYLLYIMKRINPQYAPV